MDDDYIIHRGFFRKVFFAAMENKSNMVIRYKSYQEQQERIRLLAEDYMYRNCGQRRSNKMVEAYIGLANLIEYQTSEKVREKKKNTLVNLPSKFLKEQYGRHYADMIDDLKNNGVIKVNEKYSSGAFTKSYSINDELLARDKQHENKMYTTAKAMDRDIRVYEDLVQICPDSILFDGIEYKLDKDRMMKDVEAGNIGVNQAVRGMRCFIDQKNNHGHHTNGGRDYTWFVSMGKDFRHLILGENGGEMVEALDLPAGNVMCVSLSAFKNGLIKKEELKKVIGFIKKDIYTVIMDYAAQTNPNYTDYTRKEFKHATQIFLNSTSGRFMGASGQVSKFFHKHLPNLYRHIRTYPRNEEGKKTMYWDFIEVEKILIKEIQDLMLSRGIHTIRVHDAVYADSTLLPKDFDGDKLVFSIVEDETWLNSFLTM
jgi:hypothetical protein